MAKYWNLTVKHAITNQTATWNISFSYALHVVAPKKSTVMAEVLLSAYCAFSLSGTFYFGHGSTTVSYQSTFAGYLNQSTKGMNFHVYGSTKLPRGSHVSIYNVLELEVKLYSDHPTSSSASAVFDMATGGNQAQLVSWVIQ